MKNYWILPALLLLAAAGCKDDGTVAPAAPDFKVTYSVTYDGEQLEKEKDYPYDDFTVRWAQFRLAISDVTLLKGAEEVRLSESEYFDFTPDNSPTNLSRAIEQIYQGKVLPGEYTGVKIGFGVKPELNANKPADYTPEDPLYFADYWSAWHSYIFMSVIGAANFDNTGGQDVDLIYHCGGNQCYQVFTFDHPITVTTDGGEMSVAFDLKKLFTTAAGVPYDIQTTPTFSHNSDDVLLMEELMSHFQGATSVQ